MVRTYLQPLIMFVVLDKYLMIVITNSNIENKMPHFSSQIIGRGKIKDFSFIIIIIENYADKIIL